MVRSSRRILSSDESDGLDGSAAEEELPPAYYQGKRHCFYWDVEPVRPMSQGRGHNVIRVQLSKLKVPALALGNKPTNLPREICGIFTDDIVQEIVTHTNVTIEIFAGL